MGKHEKASVAGCIDEGGVMIFEPRGRYIESDAASMEIESLRQQLARQNKRCDHLGISLGEIKRERDALVAAIETTLDENGHLADGENCTLIVLKRALRKVCGHDWQDDGDNMQIVCQKCGDRRDVDLSWQPGEVEALINSAFPESELHNAKVRGPEAALSPEAPSRLTGYAGGGK